MVIYSLIKGRLKSCAKDVETSSEKYPIVTPQFCCKNLTLDVKVDLLLKVA